MKKYIFLFLLGAAILLMCYEGSFAAVAIPGTDSLADTTIDLTDHNSGDGITGSIRSLMFSGVFPIVKRILMGLLVIYMVYTGAMMIMSAGGDEESLSNSKRQLWYSVVALVFINIPGTLYYAFRDEDSVRVGGNAGNTFTNEASDNILINSDYFGTVLTNSIIYFLDVMIFVAAIFMLTLAGINLISSRGREEKLKEAKNKVVYTILALVFLGIIEAWKSVAYGGSISEAADLFGTLADLALFFAAPIAIFFLSLSAYYFITAAGDEERVKKAKSIVINTMLATLILLASYTFLLDLSTL